MVIFYEKPTLKEDLIKLLEDYPDYIKIVVDIEKNILAAGGKYHIDGEEILIREGSKQESLYGGGYNMITREIEYMAMSNYKPQFGHITYEIADEKIRARFREIALKIFEKLTNE